MTQQESNQQQYPQNYPPYEDEINLIDYLKVLWKWKWLIIAGTLICAVAAAVISSQMPKIYRVAMVIEPGIIGLDESGNYIYMNYQNISGKINEGSYNNNIKKLLNIDPSKTNLEFKADVSKFTNQIRISAECKEKHITLGLKASKQLIALISDDYEKVVEQRKNDYDRKIIAKQNDIKKLEAQGESLKRTLKNIRRRIDKLERELSDVKNNTEDLITHRDLLLRKGKIEAEVLLLFYSTTIQQNISYFNQINNQIYSFKEKEEGTQQKIKNLEKDIDTVKAEIIALNTNKELISNIKAIQEPEVSLHPVKSKKKQIVLLAGVVALFMTVFLAFFIEYIKNASKASSANKRT